MKRYFEIAQKFTFVQSQIEELEAEYKDKIKGDVYRKKKALYIKKLEQIKQEALSLGSNGTLCHIHGKLRRPHRKSRDISVVVPFNLYFTNVAEEDVPKLVKLHVKNVLEYSIKFIKPGVVITTS